jgi:AcrR family transcriptional regulator
VTASKPLRRDAERNRQRILDAAAELFAERGLGVTLNEIAHHAGVGVGTVYRRFPDKTQLVQELFEQRIEQVVGFMEEAAADPDPWRGLTTFLERSLALQSRDIGLKELVLSDVSGFDSLMRIRARLLPIAMGIVQRAQAAGQIRPDFAPTDLPMIQLMVSTVIDGSRDVRPDLYRRYLAILLQGLRADPGPPEPITVPPLDTEHVEHVMSRAKLLPR